MYNVCTWELLERTRKFFMSIMSSWTILRPAEIF
jgi:hypothetical protein